MLIPAICCGFAGETNRSERRETSEVLPTESQKTLHFPSGAEQRTVPVSLDRFRRFAPGSMEQNGPTKASTQQPAVILFRLIVIGRIKYQIKITREKLCSHTCG